MLKCKLNPFLWLLILGAYVITSYGLFKYPIFGVSFVGTVLIGFYYRYGKQLFES